MDDDKILRFPGSGRDSDVLQTLQAALSESESEKSVIDEAQRPVTRLSIKGDRNMQVAGDVHVHHGASFPSRGDFISCPACGLAVGRYADHCLHCGNNVTRHFQQIHRARVQRRATYVGGGLFTVFLIAMALMQLDLPVSWHWPLTLVAGISAFLALLCAREI
jgi:hypothetical protein